ncbi:MAG: hypothetical protein LBJ14_10360 [Desulfarculales bacterium]|jgi:hypothetical protein|nr:hypothetical protein [Desulfarculales bacterium]
MSGIIPEDLMPMVVGPDYFASILFQSPNSPQWRIVKELCSQVEDVAGGEDFFIVAFRQQPESLRLFSIIVGMVSSWKSSHIFVQGRKIDNLFSLKWLSCYLDSLKCKEASVWCLRIINAPSPMTVPTTVNQAIGPVSDSSAAILDDKRRYRALAKAAIIRLYLDWQRKHGAARAQKRAFVDAYLDGTWPDLLKEFGPRISWQSLERWKLEQARMGSVLALADKRGIAHKGRTNLTDQHRAIILEQIRSSNTPNTAQSARQIRERCIAEGLWVPSEQTIIRFVKICSPQTRGGSHFVSPCKKIGEYRWGYLELPSSLKDQFYTHVIEQGYAECPNFDLEQFKEIKT